MKRRELLERIDFEKLVARFPLLPRGTYAERIFLLPNQSLTPKIFSHIDFVDPEKKAAMSDGTVRMPRIELSEALQRYG